VLADAHGRCLVGRVGKHAFQPGFELDHARFALAAPDGKADALTRMLGSQRTIDVEVELALSPVPTEAVVGKWIDQARGFVAAAVAPVHQQLASQGEMVELLFEVGGVLGDRGFLHKIKDKALILSWRTDRIPERDLAEYDARLQRLTGSVPP
jgi:hypothetical protein